MLIGCLPGNIKLHYVINFIEITVDNNIEIILRDEGIEMSYIIEVILSRIIIFLQF